MKTVIILLVCVLAACLGNAQQGGTAGIFSPVAGRADYVTPDALGYNINVDSIDYSECKGSPYWNDAWNPAIVVLKNGKVVSLTDVRLDAYTNQIRYKINQGPELVAKAGTLDKVIFENKTDTTKLLAAFESFGDIGRLQKRTDAPFCQILNFGKVQLIKSYTVIADKKVDPIEGKTVTTFHSQVDYYLLRNNIFFPLKKMNKENVMSFVVANADANNWLDAQKNKLKNEKEIISFLDYYNAAQ